jgi:hypothetical protein
MCDSLILGSFLNFPYGLKVLVQLQIAPSTNGRE